MTWIFMAVLSAVFARLTAILAKCGIRKTDSDVATALRTLLMLAGTLAMAIWNEIHYLPGGWNNGSLGG